MSWLAPAVESTAVFTDARQQERAPRSSPWNEAGPFDSAAWLPLRFGIDIPLSQNEFPIGRWRGRLEDLAPRGTLIEVVGQALDIFHAARRIRAIATPGQGAAHGNEFNTEFDGAPLPDALSAAVAGLSSAPGLLHAVGLDRLVEAVFWSAQRLDHSIKAWADCGLVGGGCGAPEETPRRALNDWLRRAGARDIEVAALLLHLGVDSGLHLDRTRNEALKAFAGRRVKNLGPLVSGPSGIDPLRVLAWLAASEQESRRAGLPLHALTGLQDLHPVLSGAPPPAVIEPTEASPWFWVPVPAWAMPRAEALREYFEDAARTAERDAPDAVERVKQRLEAALARRQSEQGRSAPPTEAEMTLALEALRLLGVVPRGR